MQLKPQIFISGEFMMERMDGKGGWTFVILPAALKNPEVPNGWLKVTGKIDSYDLGKIRLMPLKGGDLFLPVKAAIRKSIKKEAGETVLISLFADYTSYGIPAELIECLEIEPAAYKRFLKLSESEQKRTVEWIYDAKTEETKVRRIGVAISRLME